MNLDLDSMKVIADAMDGVIEKNDTGTIIVTDGVSKIKILIIVTRLPVELESKEQKKK